MTIEQSHGKARTIPARSSDLQDAPGTADDRRGQRDRSGRFMAGNGAAIGRGEKLPIRHLLGDRSDDVSDPEVRTVATDAARLFGAAIAELPYDGATVRQMVGLQCRHFALAAFWTSRSERAGLATPEGIDAAELASRHGQRAERLAISAYDLSTKLAARHRKSEPTWADRAAAEIAAAQGGTDAE